MVTEHSATSRSVLLAGTILALLTCVLVGAVTSRAGVRNRGGTIAFLRSDAAFSHLSLFAIQADGTGLRRLTPSAMDVISYKWSPDGSRIAYLEKGGALWVARPGSAGRQLLASSSRYWDLSWSPDGKSIAVFAVNPTAAPPTNGRHLTILVVPTDGGAPRTLPTGDITGFAWSPRDDTIVYFKHGRVWTIRSDGTGAHPLHISFGGAGEWSPDGKHLGFGGCRRVRARCVARYAGIYVADADGSNVHLVTGFAYNEYGFAWSPDGQSILYGRANREGIYIIGADGRNNLRLTRDAPRQVDWGALTWAPDGRTIAYATDRTGYGDIYAIDADGRNKVRLTSSAASDIDPSWEP